MAGPHASPRLPDTHTSTLPLTLFLALFLALALTLTLAPVIGADLKKNCDKYTSTGGGVVFSLHKENF